MLFVGGLALAGWAMGKWYVAQHHPKKEAPLWRRRGRAGES